MGCMNGYLGCPEGLLGVTANVDDVQLEKADGPMEATVAAMDTLPRLVHPEKAEAPMLVPDADMVAGIDMTLRPAPANAESPMLTRLELAANVTANVDDVQPVKADVPIGALCVPVRGERERIAGPGSLLTRSKGPARGSVGPDVTGGETSREIWSSL